MPWNDLVKNALLGVENSSFKEAALDKLTQLGVSTSAEASLILADGVALLTQMRKAGFLLHDFEGEIPSIAPSNTRTDPSLKIGNILSLILSGPQRTVLAEFLFLLKKHGKTLPTAEVPSLMALPEINKIWPQIEPLLGEAGQWLLSQHPEWSLRLQDPSNFDWKTGSRSERLAQLKFWRKQSPSFAIELLTSTWESESPADKAAFINCLELGLSISDEPFLEQSLDDRRKEVRQAAPPLLAKISGSQLSLRMTNRATDCFSFKNNSLKINNLEEPDLAAQRDGILQLHPGWLGGVKAGHLGQLVSLVPPTHWESVFEKTPTEVLDLFSKTDWGETLVRACLESTVFHQNSIWAAAIFEFRQENQQMSVWELAVPDRLASLLPDEEVNRLALNFLNQTTGLPTEFTPVFSLLKNSEAEWSDELRLLIVNRFRMEIVKDYRQIWQLQHLNGYLQMLGLRCDPALYDQLQTGWSNDSVQWRMWEKPVEEMLARVLFRNEMLKEFRS
ncbi:MAG: DUF5691 domain-containing protein [Saprospiraceae bacterium]|nr:DUF5691 domain-containing protein [Saprospiraceae bacterium]MCF8248328.1 DUF5691 domain-containing protein [Saprospiraceae bacterium]MCF8280233.1 DUF5691 domain-containing protein [Bacteroidales bacterium]MCF8309856.1 DUF5691 domain-containing protein [Saprospiraceae bacterium]MCF8438813.1 DUF5691 domain-containing protein [Saprospiraceae bacterium]